MATRLRRRLELLDREQRGMLMGFLPAGFPTPDRFQEATRAAFGAGLDVLEVSMPGPAPELDGPLIQDAARRASAGVDGIPHALRLAAAARAADDDTIVALAYASTFDHISIEEFLDELERADIDAYLLPQHPLEEQLAIGARAQERGIEPVLFLYRQEDLPLLAASPIDRPVIYLQSADLRTGGAFNPDKAAERLSELAEALADKEYSVCVGFGVRGPEEIDTVMACGADGAIIGTRLVRAADEGPDEVAALVDQVAPALVGRTRPHADAVEYALEVPA
ncbi:tryptophan synthase subunit alpha [Microbacterium aquimaris]|uniref:tryptophan synthase subunit alpha n=1 Tax=Microbacterium aquimaris TaxID=459816 RepID=UPI002AD475AD|nr:tryptophan synthase subunit alpha [Microbacterium aquimaris]MDZ8274806.1 tryptophan synthase subunit alpha [Microbacterium aquimaris]